MAVLAATAALLLAALAGGSPLHDHKWRDGIQVWQSSSKGRDVMWGRCSGWFRKMRSCILKEATCSAHLSQGPEDADVEVRLGNLPVFKNHPTFVQWWAPRRSEEPYDPFANPGGAQVYPSMFEAYPRYFDQDFNGGNVQVSPDGTAVIRFRAPATYRVHKHTRTPHVHLRICSGGSDSPFSVILGRKDKVQLTPEGPVAKSECNSAENKINVLGFRRLGDLSITAKSLVSRGMGLVSQLIEQIDLDALEFSPVFQCLSAGLYYDHIHGDCAAACPAGAVINQGQCVKPAVKANTFSAMWHLQICGCDEQCWADKRNGTLHRLRLEIADHLDIPLHEVEELDISFDSKNSNPHMASLAHMHIRISSPRHTPDTGAAMLRSLFLNMEGSSEVLAMLVLGVRELFVKDLGFLHKRIKVSGEDAFAPFYEDLDIVRASAAADGPAPGPVQSAAPALGQAFGPTVVPTVVLGLLPGLALALFGCTAAALTKCCRSSAGARELSLRSLGEPLAAVEHSMEPRILAGSVRVAHVDAGTETSAPPAQEGDAFNLLVPQYLATVYARAVR